MLHGLINTLARSASKPRLSLWILLGLYLVLSATYAIIMPPLDGPDSGAHFGYAYYLRKNRQLPILDGATSEFSHELVQQPPLYYAAVAALLPERWMNSARATIIGSPYIAKGTSLRATVVLPKTPFSAHLALSVARLISWLGGLLAVVATYWGVCTWRPNSPWLACAVASWVGFNPQFLCVSTSITNDAWLAGASAWAVFLAVRALYGTGRPLLRWLGIGAVAGAAALAKYSGLLITIPLAFVWVLYARRKGIHCGLWAALGAGLGFLGVAGFWYVRNLILWQELVPLKTMLAVLPGLRRDTPLSWPDIADGLRWLPRSYWGVFGYGVLAPEEFFVIIRALMVVAVVGLMVLPWRTRQDRSSLLCAVTLAIVWLGAMLYSLASWMRQVRFSDQGRLLFGAAPAVSLLIILGLGALTPHRWRVWSYRFLPLFLFGLALWPVPTLCHAYRLPRPLSAEAQPQREMDVHLASGVTLLGVDLPQGAAVDAGGELPVTLYFTTDRPIPEFLTLFVHLVAANGRLLYQYDGPPASGRHPTPQWQPGQVFADDYVAQIGELDASELGRLVVGFYPFGQPSVREQLVSIPIRLHSDPRPTGLATPLAHWVNGIVLLGQKIETSSQVERVKLRWGSEQTVHIDYTVSVQWLDRAGNLVAQVDKQPQQGAFPTSTWRTGDMLEDEYMVTASMIGDAHRIIVLLYDQDGRRLPLTSDGAPDHYVLESR